MNDRGDRSSVWAALRRENTLAASELEPESPRVEADRLRSILDGQLEMIACSNAEDRLTFVNATLARRSPAAVVGRPVLELFAGEDREQARRAFDSDAPAMVTHSGGTVEWTIVRKAIHRLLVGRRRAPQLLDEERAGLLRETDHRVKNNLQIVTSLLRLRLESVDDPAMAAPLLDCQRRIAVLSLAHEHLHHALPAPTIDATAYFTALVGELVRGRRDLPRIDLSLTPISLRLEAATRLGLLVSELVSNALRHAWVDPARGRLSIDLLADGDWIRLSVSDDGRGVVLDPAAVTSLGLPLVRQLAAELGGAFTLSSTSGTRASLVFPRRSS